MGRCVLQLLQGLDSLAVRERQIDHDRCDFLPSLAAQPFDGVAAAIHILDFERAVA